MASILIFSENRHLLTKCVKVLATDHHVSETEKLDADSRADVIIVDTDLLDRHRQILELIQTHPAHFLLTGSQWPEEKQIDAILHSADGYYDLAEPDTMLHKAITRILQGDIWVHRRIVPKVIHSLILNKQAKVPPSDHSSSIALDQTLSSRELDVANMIKEGKNNKQIAEVLNISERTVKAHLTSIFRKLNVTDRLHLAILLQDIS